MTSYTVTPYVGSTAGTPVTVTGSPPATSTTVSGLTNGTTYTFKVTATNSLGTGPASAPSNAVTPGLGARRPDRGDGGHRRAGLGHGVLDAPPAAARPSPPTPSPRSWARRRARR